MEHVWHMCEMCLEYPACIYEVSSEYLRSISRLSFRNRRYSNLPVVSSAVLITDGATRQTDIESGGKCVFRT